ncbi:phage tail tube protein [Mesonia aquimarina]|uniref:phage tail tube protein n=1 Tax=Mesonia aquimarina TaxID=1504967 RepID=UPI000EF5BDDA|nr:phage tail tube protein [Mesonia aquimarina]
MAGEKVINGELRLTLDDGTVYHATSCSLSLTREIRDRITKDTDGIERAKGKKSWTATMDALATYNGDGTDTNDFFLVFDMYDDDSTDSIAIEFVPDEDDATYKLTGTAFISQLDLTAPVNEDATTSISLSGTNKLNKVEINPA